MAESTRPSHHDGPNSDHSPRQSRRRESRLDMSTCGFDIHRNSFSDSFPHVTVSAPQPREHDGYERPHRPAPRFSDSISVIRDSPPDFPSLPMSNTPVFQMSLRDRMVYKQRAKRKNLERLDPLYHRAHHVEMLRAAWEKRLQRAMMEDGGARMERLELDGITDESSVAETLAAFSRHLKDGYDDYGDEGAENGSGGDEGGRIYISDNGEEYNDLLPDFTEDSSSSDDFDPALIHEPADSPPRKPWWWSSATNSVAGSKAPSTRASGVSTEGGRNPTTPSRKLDRSAARSPKSLPVIGRSSDSATGSHGRGDSYGTSLRQNSLATKQQQDSNVAPESPTPIQCHEEATAPTDIPRFDPSESRHSQSHSVTTATTTASSSITSDSFSSNPSPTKISDFLTRLKSVRHKPRPFGISTASATPPTLPSPFSSPTKGPSSRPSRLDQYLHLGNSKPSPGFDTVEDYILPAGKPMMADALAIPASPMMPASHGIFHRRNWSRSSNKSMEKMEEVKEGWKKKVKRSLTVARKRDRGNQENKRWEESDGEEWAGLALDDLG